MRCIQSSRSEFRYFLFFYSFISVFLLMLFPKKWIDKCRIFFNKNKKLCNSKQSKIKQHYEKILIHQIIKWVMRFLRSLAKGNFLPVLCLQSHEIFETYLQPALVFLYYVSSLKKYIGSSVNGKSLNPTSWNNCEPTICNASNRWDESRMVGGPSLFSNFWYRIYCKTIFSKPFSK